MNKLREALQALVDENNAKDDGASQTQRALRWRGLFKQAEAALAEPPSEGRELTDAEIVKMWGFRSDGPDNHEIVSFARAVIAADRAQRVPLTEDQVFASQDLMYLNGSLLPLAMPQLMEVIRTVERAHKIGGNHE